MYYTIFIAIATIIILAIILATSEKQQVSLIMSLLRQKDLYSYNHSVHVAKICRLIYRKLPKEVQRVVNKKRLVRNALVHDVGKIGMSEFVLRSKDSLLIKEYDEIRHHTLHGHKLLVEIEDYTGAAVAYTHHEREDGNGYWGLESSSVSWYSKIISVADAFSAMVSNERVYARPKSVEEAIGEIRRYSGTQFNPIVAEAFCKIDTLDLTKSQ